MNQIYPPYVLCVLFSLLSSISSSSQSLNLTLGVRQSLTLDYVGYNGTNTYQAGEWWNEPKLMGHIPLLKPKTLRYPGGGISNWWDWKLGWFADRDDLPQKYKDLTREPDYLENFQITLDSCHSTAVFDLNMMTATLQDQLAMLKHAQDIGLDVKYVELGNEFYILGNNNGNGDGDSALLMQEYPTADVYGDSATIWSDSIHHYFPAAKIAAQGTFNKNNDTRRDTWDTLMEKTLRGEDAITYHCYYAAENSKVTTSTYTYDDVPEFMWRPFNAWSILSTQDLSGLPPGDEAWITEYNLDDEKKPVHGSWGHGLFLASLTMQFLQDWRITLIDCYNMNGSAVHGTYFQSKSGFNFVDDKGKIPPPNPPPTTPWDLTAGGIAINLLGQAMDQNNYVAPLYFDTSPTVTFTDESGNAVSFPALFGFHFCNSSSSDAVILNLSDVTYTINTKNIFRKGGTYEYYVADPLLYVSDDSQVTYVTGSLSSGVLTLLPYSINHIVSNSVPPSPPPPLQVTANGPTSFCTGDSVQLDAGTGYKTYQWSTGATTQKIWVHEGGSYSVRAYTKKYGYAAGDTANIIVNPLPISPLIKTSGSSDFCQGGNVVLSPTKDLSSYSVLWNNGDTAESITVDSGGNYWLTITDVNGCKANSDSESVVVYPLPTPVITPLGPTTFCYDESVVLDAGPGYKSCQWSNGKWGQTVSINDQGSYTVTVTDTNKCTNISPSIAITVHTPIDPTITVNGPTEFCTGTSPTYLITQSGYTYQWQKNGVNISGATTKKYYPTVTGNYRVTITDIYACSKTSGTTSITVDKLPIAKISVTGSKNICNGQTITLTAQIGLGYTYQWMKNGVNISGATASIYVALTAGDYTYKVTDSHSCSSNSPATTITANCKTSDPETTSEAEPNNFLIYPNPTSSEIHLEAKFATSFTEQCTIEITNLLGEVLFSEVKMLNGSSLSENISLSEHFTQGAYIVLLSCGTEVQRQQLVVQEK